MIQKVEIKNLRCIREATIVLAPLTALVGPNGSGKSTALRALAPVQGLGPDDHWQHDPQNIISVDVTYEAGRTGRWLRNATGEGGIQYQHTFQRLRLDVNALRSANQVQRQDTLDEDGRNLANVFASLSRTQQSAFAQELCRLVPLFNDVEVNPTHAGNHQLRFQDRWRRDLWYSPQEVSDGTILLTAFLTLQFAAKPIDLIAIEEPDRGLHPYLMSQLVSNLRAMTTGKLGPKPTQVVLATHSAELVEYLKPEEVRFLDRDKSDGSVRVKQVDASSEDWRAAYREYGESLGSAWLSGNLGGVPGQ